jgi:hypothetical protein
MNAHVQQLAHDGQVVHPLAVTDPKIRKLLQLMGLRFVITRAQWLISEATIMGVALKAGEMTSDEIDAKLDEMGALDLVYPELMGCGE